MSERNIDIVQFIPIGSKNAITRADLRDKTGLGDRQLREAISQARRTTCICNKQDGNGYYIPDQVQEIQSFIAQETHRAKSIFWSLKGARELMRQMEA